MNKNNIKPYITAAWACAHTALWNEYLFALNERSKAEGFIGQYISQSKDPYKAYINFCERVLLTRQYIRNGNSRYVPFPSTWLDPQQAYGFAGTASWHDRLGQQRKACPLFRMEWKALAEGILEMVEEGTGKFYRYWCTYFLEHKAIEELLLFREVVAKIIENEACEWGTRVRITDY
jgi:hypothetical protein